jgi:DNA-binding MarR family transcriptional regulator
VRRGKHDAPPVSDPVSYARLLLAAQRKRADALGGVPLGEPAWEILLDLFVQDAEGRAVSVSSACGASGAPPTTGLRYVTYLVEQGHIVRQPDPNDARRTLVRLSEGMRTTLASLLVHEAERLVSTL